TRLSGVVSTATPHVPRSIRYMLFPVWFSWITRVPGPSSIGRRRLASWRSCRSTSVNSIDDRSRLSKLLITWLGVSFGSGACRTCVPSAGLGSTAMEVVGVSTSALAELPPGVDFRRTHPRRGGAQGTRGARGRRRGAVVLGRLQRVADVGIGDQPGHVGRVAGGDQDGEAAGHSQHLAA